MKVLGYILTAAAILVGADVFVMSTDQTALDSATTEQQPVPLQGSSGIPTPPPDAY